MHLNPQSLIYYNSFASLSSIVLHSEISQRASLISNTYSSMVSFLAASSLPVATMSKVKCFPSQFNTTSAIGIRPMVSGLRVAPKITMAKAVKRSSSTSYCFKTISCSLAQPETLKTVQSTIAKQLSIDESTVTPGTKFADLGADSLDTVEIMMALEEKFQVSIGEGGAENISTVQDAADLIEKVKAAAA